MVGPSAGSMGNYVLESTAVSVGGPAALARPGTSCKMELLPCMRVAPKMESTCIMILELHRVNWNVWAVSLQRLLEPHRVVRECM
jgi:hypothetical protein